MDKEKINSLNQQIWDQKNWGFHKVAKLLEDELEKDQTSYHNVLDAFRLALKGINLVKKDVQK